MAARTVLVIGVDGLSRDTYQALRGHGYLGSVAGLESRGVAGSIDMVPPLTPPMWTSITSGVNPGKHGIYQFHYVDEYGRTGRLHNAGDVMHPRVHDIASYHGLESFVANLPLSSWPLIPFRGAIVSDWLSPRDYASPGELGDYYTRRLEEASREYPEEPCKLVARDIALAETVLWASRRGLLNGKSYIFVMFEFIDALLHKYPDEARSPREPCVKSMFGLFEEVVGELLPYAADDGLVVVVSDHGNEPTRFRVSIPRILYDSGLVKPAYTAAAAGGDGGGAVSRLVAGVASRLMRSPVTGKLVTRVGRLLLRFFPGLEGVAASVERPAVDEEHSPVVVPRDWRYGIYVNTRVVSDVERVVEAIIAALKGFEERSGHRFLHSVVRGRGGLYRGPYVDRAPHVVVAPRKGYSFAAVNLYAPPIDRSRGYGDHHPANLHVVLPPEGEPWLWEAARAIREPWDYAVLMLLGLGLPLPHDTDSRLCERAGLRCRRANYNTRYMVARRIALRRLASH